MKEKKNDNNKKTNTSVVDEFNRNKRIFKKLKFKNKDKDFMWKCFLVTLKKTFHINKELVEGLKFSLKTGAVHSEYELEKFDQNKKIVQLKWKNGDDKYWIKFYLRKKYLFSGTIIRITEHIYRSTPFWGLQDTAGLMWLKKNFKNEMNNFKKSVDIVVKNNGEIPNDVSEFYETKNIQKIIKPKTDDFNYVVEKIKSYYLLKSFNSQTTKFNSKINKHSITYNVNCFDETNKIIEFSWTQDKDEYKMSFSLKQNKLYLNISISTIWGINQKSKFKLIKQNFKEMIREISF